MNTESESLWYYLDTDQSVKGPVSKAMTKEMLESGQISDETQICRVGSDEWQSVVIALLPPVPDIPSIPPPRPSFRAEFKRQYALQTQRNGNEVREYRRTCRTCKTVWHSLVAREEKVAADIRSGKGDVAVNCCKPDAASQYKHNVATRETELSRLKQCPQCQSAVYDEEVITHDIPPAP